MPKSHNSAKVSSNMLSTLVDSIRHNPDYFGAVFSFYVLSGIQILVQLIMVPLYLDTLGKVGLGVLVTILAVVNVAGLGIAWLHGGVLRALGERYFSEEGGGAPALSETYTAVKCLCFAYGTAVAVIIALLAFFPVQLLFGAASTAMAGEIRDALLLAAIYYLLLSNMTAEYWTLSATKHQTEANIALILSPIIFFATVTPWLLWDGGLAGVVGCLIAGGLASTLAARFFLKRKVGALHLVPCAESTAILRRLIGRYALPYLTFSISFTILQADTLIIGIHGGAGMVAEFFIVWKIAEILILLLWKVPESLQPYLIEADLAGDHSRIKRLYSIMVWSVCLTALAIGILYSLFGGWFVTLWVGNEHIQPEPWAFVLAGGAIFWLGSARSPALFAYSLKRFERLNKIVFIEALSKLVLIVVLVPIVGYTAPLMAINVTYILGIAWAYTYLGREIARSAGIKAGSHTDEPIV